MAGPAAESPLADSRVLEVRDLVAGYGDTVILGGVSLSVGEGQAVALIGPNGAGKTTLLRTVAGALRPRSGQVVLHGQDVTSWPIEKRTRRGLCYIREGRGIFPNLTVRENLYLSAAKGAETAGADRAAAVFPVLGRKLKQTAGSLSGGEQQMLALVRAYLANPTLLMVDEASMGLAPVIVDEVYEFLSGVAATGMAILIVEQYIGKVLKLASEVYILTKGKIAYQGATSEVADQTDIFETYLGAGVG
jgi:branched-chain amino acid transport system ATP-binding protein